MDVVDAVMSTSLVEAGVLHLGWIHPKQVRRPEGWEAGQQAGWAGGARSGRKSRLVSRSVGRVARGAVEQAGSQRSEE